MKKYKCLDCGHQFEGDISTTECPKCGCTNIKPSGGLGGSLVWKVLGAIALLILIIILLTKCEGCCSGKVIFMTLDTSSKEYLKISTDDISPTNLRQYYKIEITNDSTQDKKYEFFNGKDSFRNIPTHDLMAGVTYHFFLVEKKTGVQPENVKWNINSYTKPLPPIQPEIAITKEADCQTKTYTITVKVTKGNADKFYLGNKSQSSNVFTDVPDGTTYTIKACDTPNNLYTEEHHINCPSITEFHVSEALIQDALNKVARREMQPGDALKVINKGINIGLTKPIDGNRKLEAALSFSYTQKKRYIVKATIEANDCSDVIKSITLLNP